LTPDLLLHCNFPEVTNILPPAGKSGSPGRPHLKTTLTEDATQQALFRLFALDRYGNP
jgi:hypothetical protein